jgi:very-short-patch-repair endonuclease
MNLPVKVRRQHPIARYIVDFAMPARKLAIEIDGGQHASRMQADAERTKALGEHGYRVIRFWNDEVPGNLDGVLQRIVAELETPPPHPDPLRPLRGRRGNEDGAIHKESR